MRTSVAKASVLILCFLHTPVLGQGADEATSPSLNPLSEVDAKDFRAFAERPLFSPSRRKPLVPGPEEDDEPAREPEIAPPDIKLLGVTSNRAGSVAIVAAGGGGGQSLGAGDVLGGWTVKRVDPTAVVFVREGETLVLRLFESNDDGSDGVVKAGTEQSAVASSNPGAADAGGKATADRPVRLIPSK